MYGGLLKFQFEVWSKVIELYSSMSKVHSMEFSMQYQRSVMQKKKKKFISCKVQSKSRANYNETHGRQEQVP